MSVETPEGVKTGFAVRKISFSTQPGFLGVQKHGTASTQGQSVVVDLGKRGVLFTVMDIDNSYRILFDAFPWPGGPGGQLSPDGIRYFSNLRNAKADLNPEKYPEFQKMVTFTNLKDPKSVKRVDYADLIKAFGDGVRLKQITIEITDEPITTGIIKWLPWLPDYYNTMLDGSRYNNSLAKDPVANSLASGSFTTERYKKN